jgi:hypothetical protein
MVRDIGSTSLSDVAWLAPQALALLQAGVVAATDPSVADFRKAGQSAGIAGAVPFAFMKRFRIWSVRPPKE